MTTVHPAFDPATRTWFTCAPEPVAEAPTLRALQAKLGRHVRITGYHPAGYAVTADARCFTMAAIERDWREGNRALRLELRRVTIRGRRGRPPAAARAPVDTAREEAAIERRRAYMRAYQRARRQRLQAAQEAIQR